MNKKLVVVGGGSMFSVGLSESLVDYARDRLSGTEVVLLDIHEEHLKVVDNYANSLCEVAGVDMKFTSTTDRRAAFEGADFILTTFRPGSHLQLEEDESIPPKYGLQGNETVSIGGIFMACRVVPVLQEICADAQELCPDAWIINYTNPTQYVADAVRRISDLKIISLCDSFFEDASLLAMLLDVDPADVIFYPGGANHGMWILDFTVNGEPGYPILEKRMQELSWDQIEEIYKTPEEFSFIGLHVRADEIYDQFVHYNYYPFSLKLYQIYGLLPAPRYYTRYHFDQDAVIAEQRSGNYITMAGFYYEKAVPMMFADVDRRLEDATKQLQTERRRGGASHSDLAVRVMDAIVNNTAEIFDVNIPNNGAVSNLPDSAIVEVAAMIDRSGPHPFSVGPLPKSVLGYQYSLILSQELGIDAALSGSRNDLLKAILAHPLVHSVDAAEKCMDELLDLQKDWLPQFYTDGVINP
ncbi:MAG: hypothetical protein GTO18_01600 [Anaerolineales bacterium]|nr:hypothetical protein [Anaerolineales bacterium]